VLASIYLDAVKLREWTLSASDSTGFPFDFKVPVRQDQQLYFRFAMRGNSSCDRSRWEGLEIKLTALDLPAVDFRTVQNGLPAGTVRFVNLTSEVADAGPQRWAWDFDNDGLIDSWREKPGTFTYPSPGTYSARLQVENGAGWAEYAETVAVAGEETWNAITDFGSIQGGNQWFYYERLGSTFLPLTWTGSYWQGTLTWTRIFSNYDHPDARPAARAWQAPWDGEMTLDFHVRETNPAGCGDGVIVKVLHNTAAFYGPQSIAAGDSTGFTEHIVRAVSAGDMIYFVTEQNQSLNCDATAWSPVITLRSP